MVKGRSRGLISKALDQYLSTDRPEWEQLAARWPRIQASQAHFSPSMSIASAYVKQTRKNAVLYF